MIKLEKISGKNVWDILKLRVSENQRSFVASNDISIIEAYVVQNENGHAFPFGIYDDETPVGFCMIGYGVDDSWTDAPAVAKDNYNIWRLMIDERFQGKGFGKEAMNRILDFIKTEPCGSAETCWLSYEPENTAAKKLYHSFGFQETGDFDENEIIATLNLQGPIDVLIPNENISSNSHPNIQTITKNSSPEEKATLFMTLFHGREDVYAKRWESAKKKTSGYSPACKNEWVPGVCHKPCSKCLNASYLPYTQDAVLKHLSADNDSVFGIYAIQPDDTCWFLAIDLDESTWEKDVQAIRDICAIHQIPCTVEKSRSGNGSHVWFFFSEKVPASTARRMGSSIVTAAMRSNARLSFASYDRMFPNQDTMPKGGFGNLIALPLQPKAARTCGGSLFINEQGIAYSDQWLFLSSLKRMTLFDVETAISQIGLYPLGELVSESDEEKPWKRSREDSVLENDPTKSLSCVIADQIYISTDGVSNIIQDRLKRLAAFRNPEFYQKQAMRMPIWDTPRVICCAEYNGNYLCLPRGCAEEIKRFAADHCLSVKWQDEQCIGKSIDVSFRGSLYTEQQIAFEMLKQYDKGVLSATTAFGKTVVGAALIGAKKANTLILVHRKALLDQWKERLKEFLDINESLPDAPKKRGRKKQLSLIGTYGAGKDSRSGIIDIAMMQSIEKKDGVPEWVGEYGLVIVDECHHIPAVSFENVLKRIRAKYTYGLTATPKRKDGHHPIISMYLGPIRYRVDAKEQAAQRPFSHIMIPRFTGMTFSRSEEQESLNISSYYSQIAEDDIRNHMIVDDMFTCLSEGRNCLILSERVKHVQKLAELIQQRGTTAFILIGGQSSSETNTQLQKLRSAPHDQPVVVCATGKYIGEGFDESRLDTLFLTMPISWEGILAQYAGRLHRLYDGKTEVRVYDYIDDQAVMLERMYNKRLRSYASLGYQVCGERSDTYLSRDVIYDQKTFIEPFLQDIRKARHSVVIVSPYIKTSRVHWLLNTIHENCHPLKTTVITRPSDAFQGKSSTDVYEAIQRLAESNVETICKNAIHQKFAIIDQKIVWYGSINLLSFGSSQESIIRIVTGTVAETLLKSVLNEAPCLRKEQTHA